MTTPWTAVWALRGIAALGSALAISGCAKHPTEVLITVTPVPPAAPTITVLTVTLDAAGNPVTRSFRSREATPTGVNGAPFRFPAIVDFVLGSDPYVGAVGITVEASDPTTDNATTNAAVLARGVGTGTVVHGASTEAAVELTVLPPLPTTDAGAPDGATDDAQADGGTDAATDAL